MKTNFNPSPSESFRKGLIPQVSPSHSLNSIHDFGKQTHQNNSTCFRAYLHSAGTQHENLHQLSVIKLVSWCFKPSQPQRITSGLNTNFSLSPTSGLNTNFSLSPTSGLNTNFSLPPSCSFTKSLYDKSLFSQTTTEILSTVPERKPRKTMTRFGDFLYSVHRLIRSEN